MSNGMSCPHCGYTPEINEFDYCGGGGRFFELGLEMKQEPNDTGQWYYPRRESVHGCPKCGILFINMGYQHE